MDFLLQTPLHSNFTVCPLYYMIISEWTFLSHLIHDFINFCHTPLQSSVFTQKTPCPIHISNRNHYTFLNTSGILCTFIISLYAFWDRIVRTPHNIQDAARHGLNSSSIIIHSVSYGIPFVIPNFLIPFLTATKHRDDSKFTTGRPRSWMEQINSESIF